MLEEEKCPPKNSPREPPVCARCGLSTIDLQASFVNPSSQKTIRIYKCECGKLVWDPET